MEYCISGVYSTRAVNTLNDDAFYSKHYFHIIYYKNALRNILFIFLSWSYRLICTFQGAQFVRTRKLCSLLLQLCSYDFLFSVSSRTKGCIGEAVVFGNVGRDTNGANIGPLFSAVSFNKKKREPM